MISDLQLREERYALAIDGTDDGLWDWDLKSNKIFYSNRWKRMLGYDDPEEIKDSPNEWFGRLHPDDHEKFQFSIELYFQEKGHHFKAEYRLRHKQGHYLWMLCRGCAVWNKVGKPLRFAGLQTDITIEKSREQQLLHDAFHDHLTALPNRALFMDRLNQALHGRSSFGVLYMDLDSFKQINDTLGHKAGDKLLVTTARRLETCSRAGDTIARFGGDEFTILLNNILDVSEAEDVANRIIKEISIPFLINDQKLHTTITIGISFGSSLNYKRAVEVTRDADIALYQAKKKRKGSYKVFNEKMRQFTAAHLKLEADLKRDIKRGKIVFYYQPIIDLKTKKAIGLETLLRWEHEKYGILKPESFLTLAEETRLIANLEKGALEHTLKYFKKLHVLVLNKKIFITFNISEQQLREKGFVKNLQKMLNHSKIPPSLFHFEVSENIIANNFDDIEDIFKAVKGLGFKLSLDGFGAGYSSLTYLYRYPFDYLKFDHSFIKDIEKNSKKAILIKNIIQLAKSLGIIVIAEGVESESVLKILQKFQCKYAQGFYFSKPQPIKEIIKLLENK